MDMLTDADLWLYSMSAVQQTELSWRVLLSIVHRMRVITVRIAFCSADNW